jgi:hypothetical protein
MTPYFEIGLASTILFFIYFFFLFPLVGNIEKLIFHLYSYRFVDIEDKNYLKGSRLYSFIFLINNYKNI